MDTHRAMLLHVSPPLWIPTPKMRSGGRPTETKQLTERTRRDNLMVGVYPVTEH